MHSNAHLFSVKMAKLFLDKKQKRPTPLWKKRNATFVGKITGVKRSDAKSEILHLKKKKLFEPIVILAISISSDFWMFACVQKVYIL